MNSTGSETFCLSALQSIHTNNQNNCGIIGDGSNNFVNSGTIGAVAINHVDRERDDNSELRRLLGDYISTEDKFLKVPHLEYHPNTRTTVRNEIIAWVDESGFRKSPLLWLNGPAAVGKSESVIAKNISPSENQIITHFFFSTGSDRPVATLIPTLALQLAQKIPDITQHIIASVNNGSLQMIQIEEQFDLLIIQPLKKSTSSLVSRPVIVIDGVDECTEEDMIVRFLRVIVKTGEAGDMPVRFIICSRPEPWIYAILGRVRGVIPTTNEPEPSVVCRSSGKLLRVTILSIVLIAGIISIVIIALLTGDILSIFSKRRSEVIILMPFVISLAVLAALALIVLIMEVFGSYRPTSEVTVHLHTPIQRSRSFVQGVFELYKLVRLDADKDPLLSATPSEPADAFDRICHYPVVSTIQIGRSEESKKDIEIYLADKFDETRPPGASTSSWFQQSDISRLAKASCGQFLYASIIVKLLDLSPIARTFSRWSVVVTYQLRIWTTCTRLSSNRHMTVYATAAGKKQNSDF